MKPANLVVKLTLVMAIAFVGLLQAPPAAAYWPSCDCFAHCQNPQAKCLCDGELTTCAQCPVQLTNQRH